MTPLPWRYAICYIQLTTDQSDMVVYTKAAHPWCGLQRLTGKRLAEYEKPENDPASMEVNEDCRWEA
jgi:hypothetical protein